VGNRVLQLEGGGSGGRGPLEDRERRITLAPRLDEPSAAGSDNLFDELVVTRERHRHGVSVCLPCGGRPLDIGE
jgi:hypothetical protein